jgi:hypothetical protein
LSSVNRSVNTFSYPNSSPPSMLHVTRHGVLKEAPYACRHTGWLANALRLSDVIFSDVSCASARRARQ